LRREKDFEKNKDERTEDLGVREQKKQRIERRETGKKKEERGKTKRKIFWRS
jgi:hypothetical protein